MDKTADLTCGPHCTMKCTKFPPFVFHSHLRDDAGDDVYRAEVDLQPLLDVGGDGRLGAPRAAVTVMVQPE